MMKLQDIEALALAEGLDADRTWEGVLVGTRLFWVDGEGVYATCQEDRSDIARILTHEDAIRAMRSTPALVRDSLDGDAYEVRRRTPDGTTVVDSVHGSLGDALRSAPAGAWVSPVDTY